MHDENPYASEQTDGKPPRRRPRRTDWQKFGKAVLVGIPIVLLFSCGFGLAVITIVPSGHFEGMVLMNACATAFVVLGMIYLIAAAAYTTRRW